MEAMSQGTWRITTTYVYVYSTVYHIVRINCHRMKDHVGGLYD